MTIEVRMSSDGYGNAQGHYLQFGKNDTIKDLKEAAKQYVKEYPSYHISEIRFALWKDWEQLVKNKDGNHMSSRIVQTSLNSIEIVEKKEMKRTPGFYGDNPRTFIDFENMPDDTKLGDIFEYVEQMQVHDCDCIPSNNFPFFDMDYIRVPDCSQKVSAQMVTFKNK